MASLVIAALPVHAAAMILLAATSKSPIKAATTDVREDNFLRLRAGNVAIACLRNSNHHRKAPTRRPRKNVMASEVIASRMTPIP